MNKMSHLLEWYTNHNSSIIQSLAVVIGVLLCAFIFKLFFGSKKSASSETEFANSNSENIENKINQILEAQNKKLSSSANKNEDGSLVSSDPEAVIDKLQSEIFNLKQTLKEKESAVSVQATLASAQKLATGQDVSESEKADVTEYLKQIDDLKNRLSDYEVIAEDIADLHKLREENQKLLAQISSQPNAAVEVVLMDAKAELKTETETSIQPDMDQLLKDLSADFNAIETSEAAEQDKELIRQFEKSKGS